jgi:hypothetical protein
MGPKSTKKRLWTPTILTLFGRRVIKEVFSKNGTCSLVYIGFIWFPEAIFQQFSL